MYNKKYKLLFLCQDNASYSPVAEALLRRWSDGQFITSSAGLEAADGMHPYVSRFLDERGLPDPGHSPRLVQRDVINEFDYIFLLDERVFPGNTGGMTGQGPVILDWTLPAFMPEQARWSMIRACYATLEHRIRLLCCTQFNCLDQTILYSRLNEIALLNNNLRSSIRHSEGHRVPARQIR